MAAKSQEIQKFLIDQVEKHPNDIVRLAMEHFGISRQAVNRHVKTLIEDGVLQAKGTTSNRTYSLVVENHDFGLLLSENKEEDVVYAKYVEPLFSRLKENLQRILYYGFTEMFNNVLDHSEGTETLVRVSLSAKKCRIMIVDDGMGIFERIKSRLGLHDHRFAVLELSKGKLTTDPQRHSGEGIFFTSRVFDEFSITANGLFFLHQRDHEDWLIETDITKSKGTTVNMEIATDAVITLKEVFDRFTDLESGDYTFSKTHVPLSLAKYKEEELISRSQAKRVLSRFDRFAEVFLDFKGVTSIGQAFADEIFRVHRLSHPEVKIVAINAVPEVERMINRARFADITPSTPEGFKRNDES